MWSLRLGDWARPSFRAWWSSISAAGKCIIGTSKGRSGAAGEVRRPSLALDSFARRGHLAPFSSVAHAAPRKISGGWACLTPAMARSKGPRGNAGARRGPNRIAPKAARQAQAPVYSAYLSLYC